MHENVQFGQLEADVHMLLSSYTKICFIVLSIFGKAGNWGIMLDLLLVKQQMNRWGR